MHFTQNAEICDNIGIFILIDNILIPNIKKHHVGYPSQKTQAQHRPDVYLRRVYVEAWLSNNGRNWTVENVIALLIQLSNVKHISTELKNKQ